MMIPKKKYPKTKTVTRLPSPILTVTRISNTSIPLLTVTSSASNDDCYIDQTDGLIIKLAGATFNGTLGESRQVLYNKMIDLNIDDPKKFKNIRFKFVLDQNNKYDSNAIEVLINLPGSPRDGWSMGWIPKIYNRQLIDFYSNFSKDHEDNITKIKDSKVYLTFLKDNIRFMYISIPINYNFYDLFPRPNRFALINL